MPSSSLHVFKWYATSRSIVEYEISHNPKIKFLHNYFNHKFRPKANKKELIRFMNYIKDRINDHDA